MMVAGIASIQYNPRLIGTVAGLLSSFTVVGWGWANWTGRLPLPKAAGTDSDEPEAHPGNIV